MALLIRQTSLVRELHVYELFEVMLKTLRRSCRIKKLQENFTEQKITDTIKTVKTRKKSTQLKYTYFKSKN